MSKKELAMIYHLMQTIPINLAGMMLVQIREATEKVKFCMAYGMLLTRIFEAFGVYFEGSPQRNFKATMSTLIEPFIGWSTRERESTG